MIRILQRVQHILNNSKWLFMSQQPIDTHDNTSHDDEHGDVSHTVK